MTKHLSILAAPVLLGLSGLTGLPGCSGEDLGNGTTDTTGVEEDRRKRHDMRQPGHDLRHGGHDLRTSHDMRGGNPDMAGGGGGGIGPGGGSVDHLFFAVVGDSRPPNLNDTAGYPSAIIQKIYADIEGMSPRPQFVVSTGDYQFASPTGGEGAKQLALYKAARDQYTGTVFAAMGNHECNGYTAGNCSSLTNNLKAFMDTFMKPLGQGEPYYSIPIQVTGGGGATAKLIVVACNYWGSTQSSWLQTELARPTAYTILVRHEAAYATTAPCVTEVEGLMAGSSYNLSLAGHAHHFAVSGKEVIVGNGGAPLSGGTYGYATVEQTGTGFLVTNYDYATAAPVSSTTVPF